MQEKIKSEGKCLFCSKTFTKAGINRHLAIHLKEKAKSGKAGKSFLVKVETDKYWGNTPYFLSLWIDGEAKMNDFDKFLREIWLECCGHLSAFRNHKKHGTEWNYFEAIELMEKGKFDEYKKLMKEYEGEIPMNRKVKDVLHKELVLEYEYDFSSSTILTVTVFDEIPVKADKKVVLLSRNEPLKFICCSCEKVPATQICTVCADYENEAVFCYKCAKKHAKECEDFEGYVSMPIVNSPRMGVCGYNGGTIDVERDSIFVSKV